MTNNDNNIMNSVLIPNVIERTSNGERSYDLMSRLLNDRIIFLSDEVNDATASVIIAELLYLEASDPDKPINFYLNTPGGSISAGLGIIDTMNFIKCPVSTIAIGLVASMGSLLLSAGTKGMRYSLPNTEIMIHQPLTQGISGQATDVLIRSNLLQKTKQKVNEMLAANTGKTVEQIERDTERDNFMTAEQALEYGLIDKIIVRHE